MQKSVDDEKISIHSLVKRETCRGAETTDTANHFNPLPRKEGDGAKVKPVTVPVYFNPLPRKEGDSNQKDFKSESQIISIHSLVKRETCHKQRIFL